MYINTIQVNNSPVAGWQELFYQHRFLILPGYQNSGPDHWQTLWEKKYPAHFIRVQQDDWEHPNAYEWANRVDKYISQFSNRLVLVGHSLGSNTAVQWALRSKLISKVSGLLLVAPADTDNSEIPAVRDFGAVPLQKLPVNSIVVASINDPHAVISRQAAFAAYWGSRFKTVGSKGHINALSGLDEWTEGLQYLKQLLIPTNG